MKNRYEILGDTTIIYVNSNKFGSVEVLISTSKLELVASTVRCWTIQGHSKKDLFYITGKTVESNFTNSILLHRLVTQAPKGTYVDHINHDTFDNRDENLRAITNAQNQQNRRGAAKNSKTKIRGVYWHKRAKKWYGQLKVNGKKITVGHYKNIDDAEKAVIAARQRLMPFSTKDIS